MTQLISLACKLGHNNNYKMDYYVSVYIERSQFVFDEIKNVESVYIIGRIVTPSFGTIKL